MVKTWSFQQSNYIGQYNLESIGTLADGICISLSCRWAKMMLKAGKSAFSVPNLNASQRSNYFSKGQVPQKVGQNQNEFDKLRDAAKDTIDMSKDAVQKARKLFEDGEISWAEYEKVWAGIKGGAADASLESDHSLKVITESNKLKIVESTSCQSFSEYFLSATSGSCFVFSSNDLNHAFAGYVTDGIFSYDYYFFDPNSGEFCVSGASKAAVLMSAFQNHYAKQGKLKSATRRLKVVYTGTKQLG